MFFSYLWPYYSRPFGLVFAGFRLQRPRLRAADSADVIGQVHTVSLGDQREVRLEVKGWSRQIEVVEQSAEVEGSPSSWFSRSPDFLVFFLGQNN